MKFKRTERIGAIVKILSDNPNKIFTLSHFTNQFNAAKSTISEDLLVVKNVFEKLELGKVITISGAAGGVKYIPKTSKAENEEFLLDLCQKISDPSRILSGGFLYLIDLIYNPTIVSKIGKIMASNIDYAEADYVVTMETKGIPMALMTAKAMNLPLVIIRKDIKVSEGPTLSMTYVSGNTSKVESMSLPRKALKPDSKVIIIDDFMRGGGTIKGMIDLMTEFGAEVVGTGVFISTTQPEEKMVKNYISLIELDVQGDKISVQPNLKTFKDEYKNEDYEENYAKVIDPDKATIFTIVNGLFERTADLTSFEDTFCYLLEEEEALEAFYTKLTDFHIELMKIAKEVYHADIITFHDDMGTQRSSFFSPTTFEEVMLPHYKRMNDAAHEMGLYVNFHSCGCVGNQIENFIAAGFDSWEGQDACNDKVGILGKYADELAQVSSFSPDPEGKLTDEEYVQAVKDRVHDYGKEGRYIAWYRENNPERREKGYETMYTESRKFYCD